MLNNNSISRRKFLSGSAVGIGSFGIGLSYSSKKTVLDFGVVGDGNTDDTEAIQRAVNSRIGNIFFPCGTYRVTRSIIVELDRIGPTSINGDGTAKIIMAGAGPVFKFVGTHEGTAGPASVKENVWLRQRMPMVDGLEIVGDHPEAVGIEATGTMKATFTRVLVRKALHGIHLTKRNRNVIISDCHLYDNSGIGVFLDQVNLHQTNITNCHISYNGGGGIVVRDGSVYNIQIGNCDIEGNMNHNSSPTANVLINMTKGTIGEVEITGCTIQHGRSAPNSANIRIMGNSSNTVSFVVISGNFISDIHVNIHLKRVSSATISGNVFNESVQHDLLIEDCTNMAVGSNVFELFDRNYTRRGEDSARRHGLVFRNCNDCVLSGLQVTDVWHSAGGLILEGCKRFNIADCSFLNCDGSGVFLQDVEHVRVSDCLIIDNRPDKENPVSLRLTKGRNNMIIDNMVNGELEIAPESAYAENNQHCQ